MNSTTSATTGATAVPTLAEIEQAVSSIKETTRTSWATIAANIRKQGFDPDNGAVLVLPRSAAYRHLEFGAPAWVRFSSLITSPVIMNGGHF